MLPVLKELSEGIWAFETTYAHNYIPFITSLLKGDFQQNKIDFSEQRAAARPIYVSRSQEDGGKTPVTDEKAIAILNITGAITKYDQFSGGLGMSSISEILKGFDRNEDIAAIILKIDSGGGNGYASDLLSETITEIEIPVVAFIDDMGASAAYHIASACDIVVANRKNAMIGSIGTYVTLADYTGYYKKEGVKLIEIYATKSKDKNKEYYDALKGDLKIIQERVDKWNDGFLASIKGNRGEKLGKDELWNSGKLFFAEEALKIGLIDDIDTFDNTIKSLRESI